MSVKGYMSTGVPLYMTLKLRYQRLKSANMENVNLLYDLFASGTATNFKLAAIMLKRLCAPNRY